MVKERVLAALILPKETMAQCNDLPAAFDPESIFCDQEQYAHAKGKE